MAAQLMDAARYKDIIGEFQGNKKFVSACGSHYNGVQTPIDDLLLLASWAETTKEQFPFGNETSLSTRAHTGC